MTLTVLIGIIVVVAYAFWLGMRLTRRRPPVPTDLRRADEASSQEMPTADELMDRIGDAFDQTRPPDG